MIDIVVVMLFVEVFALQCNAFAPPSAIRFTPRHHHVRTSPSMVLGIQPVTNPQRSATKATWSRQEEAPTIVCTEEGCALVQEPTVQGAIVSTGSFVDGASLRAAARARHLRDHCEMGMVRMGDGVKRLAGKSHPYALNNHSDARPPSFFPTPLPLPSRPLPSHQPTLFILAGKPGQDPAAWR